MINNNSRLSWRATAVLGLLLSILGLYMMPMFPQTGAVDLSGYGGPVFAFEMARNLTDLVNVFGGIDDPDRATRIAQMDLGNYWDFLFMLLYSAFIAAFLFAASNKPLSVSWKVMIVLALFSGGMDALENGILPRAHKWPRSSTISSVLAVSSLRKISCHYGHHSRSGAFSHAQRQPCLEDSRRINFCGGIDHRPCIDSA